MFIPFLNKIRSWCRLDFDQQQAMVFHPSVVDSSDNLMSPYWILYLRTVILFVVVLVGVAFIVKTSIIVSSAGHIKPFQNVKVIQSTIDGVIQTLNVKEGDYVRAGDSLLNIESNKEVLSLQIANQKLSSLENNRRDVLFLAYNIKRLNPIADFTEMDGIDGVEKRKSDLVEAEYKAYVSNIKENQKKVHLAVQRKRLVEEQVINFNKVFSYHQEEVEILEVGASKGLISKIRLAEAKQKSSREVERLATAKNNYKEAESQIELLQQERMSYQAEFKRELRIRLDSIEKSIDETKLEIKKIEHNIALHQVVSPLSGYVDNMAVYSTGDVVSFSQKLLEVIPDDGPLVVKAYIKNEDIGFIRIGHAVTVKVDAYPFIRYGSLVGKVTHIAKDTLRSNKSAAPYKLTIQLKEREFSFNGESLELMSGMSVIAEINIGQRSLAGYFFEPLSKTVTESFREP